MRKRVAVIGLGIFGTILAEELTKYGAEVIAFDTNPDRVENIKDKVDSAVVLDSTDADALAQFNLQDMDVVVVTMGEHFESMLLTCMILKDMGVKRIITRATEDIHKRILKSIGITEILSPEEDLAKRLAKSLTAKGFLDLIPIGENYEVAQIQAPEEFIGRTIRELDLRRRYGINLITIKRAENGIDKVIGVPEPDMKIEKGDILVVFGKSKDIDSIAKNV